MARADYSQEPRNKPFSLKGLRALTGRADYAWRQGNRLALYSLHGAAMRRLNKQMQKELPSTPPPRPEGSVPSQRRMIADIVNLFAADLKSVEDGLYPPPRDGDMSLRELLSTSRRFFEDVPDVARRRASGAHQEVFEDKTPHAQKLPRYYRQNFHFQTDGWLSEHSARIYDFQVDVLFSGATAAMRRRALVPFADVLKHRDQRTVAYLDLACGTGGLMRQALAAFPGLNGIGLDLSEPYVKVARKRLPSSRAKFITGLSENLPFPDKSLDVVSCAFLFHELPPKIRVCTAREIARVLKPGGHFLFVDSLQTGDVPEYDGLLSLFPQLFHEPYYTTYLKEDLADLFGRTGLELTTSMPAFVSKAVAFKKKY